MKIIKVAAEGINLFKDRIDIDFYAEKRVLADNSEMLSKLIIFMGQFQYMSYILI